MPRKTFKKIITSNELISKINPKNISLMEGFLREKGIRCADLTIKNYRSDLLIFFTWLLQHCENKLFTDIRKIEFSNFFSYATEELRWGSAKFARTKSTLSSFSNFIEKFYDDVYTDFRNIVLRAVDSMPKEIRREKTILTEEQVWDLLRHFSEKKEWQLVCWLSLAIGSGARFAELLRFTTDIIDENNLVFNDIFLETTQAIKTKGRTKNGKMLKKYIVKDIFLPHYGRWLIERQKIMLKNNKEHNSIFIKNNGDIAKESTVRSWCVRIEKYLEIPFYPHCSRHFIVTYLSRIGINADLIIELMGWSSVEMYKIYNDLSAKDREWKDLDKLKDSLDNDI